MPLVQAVTVNVAPLQLVPPALLHVMVPPVTLPPLAQPLLLIVNVMPFVATADNVTVIAPLVTPLPIVAGTVA